MKIKAQEEYQTEVSGSEIKDIVEGLCSLFNFPLVYFQNKVLKKQMAKEKAKSHQFEIVVW